MTIQSDREAAVDLAHALGVSCEDFTSGAADILVQAFAAHREAAFEAGREQAEREVVDHARKAAQIHHRIAAETPRGDEMRVHSLSLSRAYGAVADAIENREHRNDTDRGT